MRYLNVFAFVVFFGGLLFAFPILNASEEDRGLVILDRKPWKISWVQEKSNQWVLFAHFDNGELKTYFKKPPPEKGLGITSENKPYRQEFKYYLSGKTFISKDSQFEQWPDGARAWAFAYEDKIKVKRDEFTRYCTTAITQGVGDEPDEIRYSFVKGL